MDNAVNKKKGPKRKTLRPSRDIGVQCVWPTPTRPLGAPVRPTLKTPVPVHHRANTSDPPTRAGRSVRKRSEKTPRVLLPHPPPTPHCSAAAALAVAFSPSLPRSHSQGVILTGGSGAPQQEGGRRRRGYYPNGVADGVQGYHHAARLRRHRQRVLRYARAAPPPLLISCLRPSGCLMKCFGSHRRIRGE